MLSHALFVLLTLGSFLSPTSAALDPNGVPYPNDTSVLKHRGDQARLIAYEKKQRNDYGFRNSLSSTAALADKIVTQIRAVEKYTVWEKAAGYGNYTKESFLGENFAVARPLIATTDLFKIVKAMPKGSLLHAHLSAMLPFGNVFTTVLNTPGMVMSAATDLSNDKNRNLTQINFAHSNATITSDAGSIWNTSYVPNTLVTVTGAADAFPGGRTAFLAFLKDKLTLSVEDSEEEELGVDAIWRKFQGVFGTVGTFYNYEPLVRQFLQDLFGLLAADNVRWVEIRNGGSNGIVRAGQSTTDPDSDYWYDLFIDELAKFKASDAGSKFWGARIIWTVSRGKVREKVIADMQNALAKKAKYPKLLSGYDLVSQEDLGRPLSDLAAELIWFQRQTEALNLVMPYFFHAGETAGDGNSTDNNLFDAVMFGTRRIGHGFSLFKHPYLMDVYKEKEIAVEICLISNEALRLNADVLQHPLPALIAHGVATALSNDDPAIEGQDDAGLSYDFFEAIQGFENVGLAGLGHMAQNSVRFSNFEDQDDLEWLSDVVAGEYGHGIKARRMNDWHRDWEGFCQWVVSEFGAKYNVTS